MSTPPSDFAQPEPQPAPTPAPYAGVPAPEAPKSKMGGFAKKLVIRLGVLVLLGCAWFAYDLLTGDPTTAVAGDCVQNAGTDSKPDISVIDCKDPKATFKVLKTISSSNMDDCNNVEGSEAAYTQTSRHGDSLVLCLSKNSHS